MKGSVGLQRTCVAPWGTKVRRPDDDISEGEGEGEGEGIGKGKGKVKHSHIKLHGECWRWGDML